MSRTRQNEVKLAENEIDMLQKIVRTRTAEARTVQRAKILLYSSEGMNNTEIAEKLDINRRSVYNCISKYTAAGVDAALVDLAGRGRQATITDDENAWIISIACRKPIEFGYAQELWTLSKLHYQIKMSCEEAGHPELRDIVSSTVWGILNDAEIKPHKISYYLERRDPEFERKMEEVLIVYKQVEIQFETNEDSDTVTLSYDEKPGIQAIKNIAPDLPPSKEHGCVGRDYEYKRLGTVSLLAGMDLHSGEIIPLVRNSHKSSDFIDFLKILDEKYDDGLKIRIILDNHSAHTSKETMRYLTSRPGRFIFVFTPTHGSWLNLIESFFSKMARAFLRGIRVNTKKELIERIYRYMDEVNAAPVVYRWQFKMDEKHLRNAGEMLRSFICMKKRQWSACFAYFRTYSAANDISKPVFSSSFYTISNIFFRRFISSSLVSFNVCLTDVIIVDFLLMLYLSKLFLMADRLSRIAE